MVELLKSVFRSEQHDPTRSLYDEPDADLGKREISVVDLLRDNGLLDVPVSHSKRGTSGRGLRRRGADR